MADQGPSSAEVSSSGHWAFLKPKFVEEVGEGKLTLPLFNQGYFEAKDTVLESNFRAKMLKQAKSKPV
jgi:hypothetical protein